MSCTYLRTYIPIIPYLLMKLEEADKDGIRDLFMQGEIHQLLRHGHEALGGTYIEVEV